MTTEIDYENLIENILKVLENPSVTIPQAVQACTNKISYARLYQTTPSELWKKITAAGFRNNGIRKRTQNTYLGKLCRLGHEHENTGKSLRYSSNKCCVICSNQRENRNLSLIDKNIPLSNVLVQFPIENSAHYLGRLCPNAHKYHGYNYSERWRSNRRCILCEKEHREERRDHYIEYRKENKDKISQIKKERRLSPEVIRAERMRQQKYCKKHINRIRELRRLRWHRKKLDPVYKLNHYMGVRMAHTLHGKKMRQAWVSILGYDAEILKAHIEAQFTPEMSWDNYGTYWHIDHKKPISTFNYTLPTDDEFQRCWGLDNLRPLEKDANLAKGNKIYPEFENI
jgi:hypothetical protein